MAGREGEEVISAKIQGLNCHHSPACFLLKSILVPLQTCLKENTN